MLARHRDVATHRYRDFPPVMTPIFWNKAFGRTYGKDAVPVERSHKDRIMVTPDSPEALEEVLWMAFQIRGQCPSLRTRSTTTTRHLYFAENPKFLFWVDKVVTIEEPREPGSP